MIHNDRDATIYVLSMNSCGFEPVDMRDAEGSGITWSAQAHYCADVREGNCPDFGGCAGAGVKAVAPGESFTFSWDGTMLARSSVDSPGPNCPSTCVESVGAPAGRYVLTASAFSACEGDCPCSTDAESCPRPEGLDGAPDLTAEAPVVVGTDARVELHFAP